MFSTQSRKSLFFKAMSLFLCFTFSLSNMSFAVPAADAPPAEIAAVQGLLSVEDIGIAIDSGTIKHKYSGDSGKVIVHIQDAHCNYEAQSNINKMLDQLTKECGMKMIAVEGAEGIVDTAWFRAFPDAEIREEVADYFMKKGEITGAEYFSITSDYDGSIFGAETREYYIENLKSFTEVYPHKELIEKYFGDSLNIANRLKSIVYSPKLKKLDSKIREFESKDLELSDYAAYLHKSAKSNGINLKKYVNFGKLFQTLDYEKKIDFDIVDSERSKYIDDLSKKLPKKEMTELVAQSINFKKGHIKAVDFYSALRNMAKEHDMDMVHEYPNLFYYYIYTKLYDGIDNEGLFREIGALEIALKEKLFKGDVERDLDKYADMINMFINLANIELTNEDYDLFKEYSKEFTLEDALNFVGKLCGQYNLNYSIGDIPQEITENIPNMIGFYEVALKRDLALIDNTLKRMEEEGKDRCVLIAGGFHTRGFQQLMERKGISYIVVTPKITKNVETPYIKVLTNQRTSLEDIITDSAMPGSVEEPGKEFLAPVPIFGFLVRLYLGDANAQKNLKKLSDAIGVISVVELTFETLADKAQGRFIKAVNMYIELMLKKWEEESTEDEWKEVLKNPNDLLSAFLKLSEEAVQVNKGKLTYRTRAQIGIAFAEYFENIQGLETVGVNDLRGNVKDPKTARKMDKVIRESRDIGKAKEINRGHVLPGENKKNFLFQVHEGLFESLILKNLPTDIHPGRGGVDPGTGESRGLVQSHIDAELYRRLEAADSEYIRILERHEAVHVYIYMAKQIEKRIYAASKEKPSWNRATRKAIESELGQGILDVLYKWQKLGRPELEAEEIFVDNLGKDYQITEEMAEIYDEYLAEVRANIKKRKEALENKTANLGDLRDIVAKNEGTEDIIVITNPGDGKIFQRMFEKVKTAYRANAQVSISTYEETIRRGQWLGLLDATRSRLRGLKAAAKVVIAVMVPGKGTRLSPFSQSLFQIKPAIPMLIRASKNGPWLSGSEASLYTWNLLGYHLERLGFKGMAWKWGDEPQISSQVFKSLTKQNMDLSNTDFVRFGSSTLVTEDLARNKEWLSASPNGTLKAQVRRRERKDLLERLGIEDTEDARAMVHIGSPAFSYTFLEAAQEVFGTKPDYKTGWIDVDGYLCEALTQDKKTWQKEYELEIYTAVKKVIEKYYRKNEKIDIKKLYEKVLRNNFLSILPEGDHAIIKKALKTFGDAGTLIEKRGTEYYAEGGTFEGVDADREEIKFSEPGMHELLKSFPNFHEDCQKLKTLIEKKKGSPFEIKVIDYGEDLYWGDMGQLSKARASYHIVAQNTPEGEFARKLAMIDDVEPDEFGNRIVGDCIYPKDGSVRNSVLINTKIYGKAKINYAVLVDSNIGNAEINIESVVFGSNIENLKMGKRTFSFKSISKNLDVPDNYVHTTMPKDLTDASKGLENWWGDAAIGNIGDDDHYKRSILNNPRSFFDQFTKMRQRDISPAQIEADVKKTHIDPMVERLERGNITSEFEDVTSAMNERYRKSKKQFSKSSYGDQLVFGTSGIRELVAYLQSIKCYSVAQAILSYMASKGEPDAIALAGDYRPSTERIMRMQIMAGLDAGKEVVYAGSLPTPAIVNYGMYRIEGAVPSVEVTASHCPVLPPEKEQNGIKPNTTTGEVLKEDERYILKHVREFLELEFMMPQEKSMFDTDGEMKPEKELSEEQAERLKKALDVMKPENINKKPEEMYINRYVDAFGKIFDAKEDKMAFVEHMAVGRDIVRTIFEEMGAGIYGEHRNDDWEEGLVVDTEDIQDKLAEIVKGITKQHNRWFMVVLRFFKKIFTGKTEKLLGVFTTDGDSDRPALFQENAEGTFVYGDKLGYLTAEYIRNLKANENKKMFIAVTATVSDAVVRRLEDIGFEVGKVQIGSPYVVKAMEDRLALPDGKDVIACGFERNGGFLLGSDITLDNGKVVKALPTRDAVLSLICAFHTAKKEGKTIGELVADRFSGDYASFTWSGLIEASTVDEDSSKNTELCSQYTATMGQAIMRSFSPRDLDIVEVQFNDNGRVDYLMRDGTQKFAKAGEEFAKEINPIRATLGEYFNESRGLKGGITKINYLDGVRMFFGNNEVVHMRPSGNAPQWRIYTEASSLERAVEISEYKLPIYPELIKRYLEDKKQYEGMRIVPRSNDEMKDTFKDIFDIGTDHWETWKMEFGMKSEHTLKEGIIFGENNSSVSFYSTKVYDLEDKLVKDLPAKGYTENTLELNRSITWNRETNTLTCTEEWSDGSKISVDFEGSDAWLEIGRGLGKNIPMGKFQDMPFPVMSQKAKDSFKNNGIYWFDLFDVSVEEEFTIEAPMWAHNFKFEKETGSVVDDEEGGSTPGIYAAGVGNLGGIPPIEEDKFIRRAREMGIFDGKNLEDEGKIKEAIKKLDGIIGNGERVKQKFRFALGVERYTWGPGIEITDANSILALMGKNTIDEKIGTIKKSLTEKQLDLYKEDYLNGLGKESFITWFQRNNVTYLPKDYKKINPVEYDKLKTAYFDDSYYSGEFNRWLTSKIKSDFVAERWVGAGVIDVGVGYADLPIEVLSLWSEEIFGREHIDQYGAENRLTAKHLTSRLTLSLQMHKFAEMFVALEDGEAYIGFKEEGVTPEKIKEWCLSGTILSRMNKVQLNAGQSIVVPAFMPHAYGPGNRLVEVKSVSSSEDATGTISFFDRGKYFDMSKNELENLRKKLEEKKVRERDIQLIIEKIIEAQSNKENPIMDLEPEELKLVNDAARWKKDIRTMDAEQLKETMKWLSKAEQAGTLRAVSGVGELEYKPKVIDGKQKTVCEKMGEVAGRFVSLRYTVAKGDSIAVNDLVKGRYHTLFVTKGSVEIKVNGKDGKTFKLEHGAEMPVYAAIADYTIVASEDAVVYTQVQPLAEKYEIPRPFKEGEIISPTGVPEWVIRGEIGYSGITVDMADIIEINKPQKKVRLSSGYVKRIVIRKGTVEIYKYGKIINTFHPGETFEPVTSTEKNGSFYSVKMKEVDPVEVKVDYERDDSENLVYSTYNAIQKKDNIQAIKDVGRIVHLMPKAMFKNGMASTRRDKGSSAWYEDKFKELISDEIEIKTCNDGSRFHMGVDDSTFWDEAIRGYESGAINILYVEKEMVLNFIKETEALPKATPEEIEEYENRWKFIHQVRFHWLPKEVVLNERSRDMGIDNTWEVIAAGLLQAAVTPKMVQEELIDPDPNSLVADVQNLYIQNGVEALGRDKNLLYGLLSMRDLKDINISEEIQSMMKDANNWVKFISTLLMKMPIKPFNPTSDLNNRRKIMWSA